MSQHYSDPTRENEPTSLPDLETFYVSLDDVLDATFETWQGERLRESIVDSARRYSVRDCATDLEGWYYWTCFPGCLPDSDPIGPFDSEQEAIDDARQDR